jgi:hypothetical protein
LFHSSSSASVMLGLCSRLVFMALCLLVCLGPFGLGARLAQCVGCGNNKNAHFLRAWCVDVLALVPMLRIF